jgi:hypothetical protein
MNVSLNQRITCDSLKGQEREIAHVALEENKADQLDHFEIR